MFMYEDPQDRGLFVKFMDFFFCCVVPFVATVLLIAAVLVWLTN